MPHVSKHPLQQDTKREVEERIVSFLVETNTGDRKNVFRELFTKTERTMIAKRLTLIFLLSRGVAPYGISRILKISPSTVARFKKSLDTGAYASVATWLTPQGAGKRFLGLLKDLASVPFEAKRKSVRQMIREAEEKYAQ